MAAMNGKQGQVIIRQVLRRRDQVTGHATPPSTEREESD